MQISLINQCDSHFWNVNYSPCFPVKTACGEQVLFVAFRKIALDRKIFDAQNLLNEIQQITNLQLNPRLGHIRVMSPLRAAFWKRFGDNEPSWIVAGWVLAATTFVFAAIDSYRTIHYNSPNDSAVPEYYWWMHSWRHWWRWGLPCTKVH